MYKYFWLVLMILFHLGCKNQNSKAQSEESHSKSVNVSTSVQEILPDFNYYYNYSEKGINLLGVKYDKEHKKIIEAIYKTENENSFRKYSVVSDSENGEHYEVTFKNGNHEFTVDFFSLQIVIENKDYNSALIFKNQEDKRIIIVGAIPEYFPVLIGTSLLNLKVIDCKEVSEKHKKYHDAFTRLENSEYQIFLKPNPKQSQKIQLILIEKDKELIFEPLNI